MTQRENGVAPTPKATGDGNYSIPTGWQCIGFGAKTDGNVAFSTGGESVVWPVTAGVQYAFKVDSFAATGTTATGVYAFLVK